MSRMKNLIRVVMTTSYQQIKLNNKTVQVIAIVFRTIAANLNLQTFPKFLKRIRGLSLSILMARARMHISVIKLEQENKSEKSRTTGSKLKGDIHSISLITVANSNRRTSVASM